MTESSIVRQNLMDNVNYRPYCGNPKDYTDTRTVRQSNGQFICPNCKWISSFDEEFVKRYKQKHNLE